MRDIRLKKAEKSIIMFKTSIFNYYTSINDSTIIYNSLTETLLCIHGIQLLNSSELLLFFNSTWQENQKVLLQCGVIVNFDADEDRIASVKLFDKIANKDLYLTIMTTYACNFRCKYCYENDNSNNSFKKISISNELQRSIVQYVKKSLGDYHCMIVEWHGGEPLNEIGIINRLSREFIDLSARLGKPYVGTVTTNGFYLTSEIVNEMVKNHVIKFHVTLDGFAWNHDYYRPDHNGNPTFSRIMSNLLDIKNNVSQRNFHIILRTNITKSFLPHLEDWLQYISENFSDDSRFQLYIKMVEDKGGRAVDNIRDDLLESESEMYNIIANSSCKNNYEFYYSGICNAICSAAMRNKHIIAPDGTIKKCGHYLSDPRSEVGVLSTDGYINYDRAAFSKWINAGKRKTGKCVKCALWASCFNSFCILKSELSTSTPKAICSGEHQNIDKILKILLSSCNTRQPFVQHIN